MTMQGPRTTIVASEVVPAGSRLAFEVRVFQNGTKKGDEIRPDTIYWLLRHGENAGLGQWRSGGWGRFRVVRCVVREADVPWRGASFEPWQRLHPEDEAAAAGNVSVGSASKPSKRSTGTA